MAEELKAGILRDRNVDWLLEKIWVGAQDIVQNVASTSWVGVGSSPATLSIGWSAGSSTYAQLPSSRFGGIVLAATTSYIDWLWRVPSRVDKRHPIYFRHHWTSIITGLTPSVTFKMLYATLSAGGIIAGTPTSPTAVLDVAVPLSSNSVGNAAPFGYNLTGRGSIQPLATGLAAYQIMQDTIESMAIAINPVSTNWAIASNPIYWLGMDIEFTPRRTYGDGSRREGRKMESNLGFGEIGAANEY